MKIVAHLSQRGIEEKNFLPEKCKNWITWKGPMSTRKSNVEHVESTVSTGSSRRKSSKNVGICPASKSNARNSANSSTLSGRETTATHLISRCANSKFMTSYSCIMHQ